MDPVKKEVEILREILTKLQIAMSYLTMRSIWHIKNLETAGNPKIKHVTLAMNRNFIDISIGNHSLYVLLKHLRTEAFAALIRAYDHRLNY